ncbi:hypothetical protein Lfu02_30450 [Longispora fulva]|uniref:Uncharacterized protein n=1 Tax=Longispora fulva TaxID=619741 RepID=A0A8J7GJB9_9ACTN|nr:hypothetical protein [Longispora fulva]MBG6139181.1 hypothetical protein [Longispora fulva]GIG58673.1 hypothetical protein Lfu02_30450 [Longispora fulva]
MAKKMTFAFSESAAAILERVIAESGEGPSRWVEKACRDRWMAEATTALADNPDPLVAEFRTAFALPGEDSRATAA